MTEHPGIAACHDALGHDAVLAQLSRILASGDFARSRRMRQFLRFVVIETLAGRADRLKEFTIATEVFGRDESFDPRNSALVRVEASRLRRRLNEYYHGRGRADPVKIALPVGSYVPRFGAGASQHPADKPESDAATLLIEPFAVSCEDDALAALSWLLGEDLATALTPLRWLRVSLGKPGGHGDGYALGGSLRRYRDRLRVVVRLYLRDSGVHLWSGRWDLAVGEPLAAEDEIISTVLPPLRTALGRAERELAQRTPFESRGVWKAYQLGLWHFFRFTPEASNRARRYFAHAATRDPAFAPAQAAIAYSHFTDISTGYDPARKESTHRTYDMARAALALDDREPMAHFALGRVLSFMNDYEHAEAEIRSAIEIDANFALAYWGLAMTYGWGGHAEEAIAAADKAEAVSRGEPWLWGVQNIRGVARLQLGDFEAAYADVDCACRCANAGPWPSINRAALLGHLGRVEEARSAYAEVLRRKPAFSVATAVGEHSPLDPDREFAHLDSMFAGLRKAGLDIPERPSKEDSHSDTARP